MPSSVLRARQKIPPSVARATRGVQQCPNTVRGIQSDPFSVAKWLYWLAPKWREPCWAPRLCLIARKQTPVLCSPPGYQSINVLSTELRSRAADVSWMKNPSSRQASRPAMCRCLHCTARTPPVLLGTQLPHLCTLRCFFFIFCMFCFYFLGKRIKIMDGAGRKRGPLLVFDFDRTITDQNTDTEVSSSMLLNNYT